jgi:hypothetical protein
MSKLNETSALLRILFLFCFCVAVLCLVLIFGACSDSTDPIPKPEDLIFTYTPVAPVTTLFVGQETEFSIGVSPSVQLGTQWKLNGEIVGEDAAYHYESRHIGIDTLGLSYSYSSVNWDRIWYVDVLENPTTIPPVVPFVSLDHGPEVADVIVSWHIIPQSTYPVVEYRIAMSYEDEVTTENWADAIQLGAFVHNPNQIGYNATFTQDDQMIPGELAWFAVRGVDEAGQMSSIEEPHSISISFEWTIEGFVYGDDGQAINGGLIEYVTNERVEIASDGSYRIRGVPNVNIYNLRTITENYPGQGEPYDSYYDFVTPDIHYDPDGNYDIMLLTRYGMDDSCEYYDFEFMSYFRYMTRTFTHTNLRPNYILYKWENYPVPVYVPPFISPGGLDFQSLCREVIGFWNTAMGDDYLVLVDTPEEAGIEFDFFSDPNSPYGGLTELTKPDEQLFLLGDVIPEKIMIRLWDAIPQGIMVQETAMHEMGHALGLFTHTRCSGENFLMANNPSGILDNGPENAVHIDEKRIVRAIRNLPQGTDVSAFDHE